MAERLDNYDFKEKELGRPPKYPWHLWLNGATWKIKQGVDFTCGMRSMVNLIRRTADGYGMYVRISQTEQELTLQAKDLTPDGEKEKPS